MDFVWIWWDGVVGLVCERLIGSCKSNKKKNK